MGNAQTVELMEEVHTGYTFWGNADASKRNDLHHTFHSKLPVGTKGKIVSAGVVEVEENYKFCVGGKHLNINETEWRLVSGPPSEHALSDRSK
jgi:hypothetical protein